MTILVKTAILISFVRNNVKLNIKWNMTENNDMFNTLAYPILILVRYWYTHLKTFRPLLLWVSFSISKTQLLSFTTYHNPRSLTHGSIPWDDRLIPHMTYDHHPWDYVFSSMPLNYSASTFWSIWFLHTLKLPIEQWG